MFSSTHPTLVNHGIKSKKRRVFVAKKIMLLCLLIVLGNISSCHFSHDTNLSQLTLITSKEDDKIIELPLDSLIMTDPYIFADHATQTYYMIGSGANLWKSADLHLWKGPYSYIEIDTTSWMGPDPLIWASEIHKYKDKYYCFTTFTNTNLIVDTVPGRHDIFRRGTHILIAEKVEGPYRPINNKPYLSEKWSTLDGTLYVEDGIPYLVFNHDWMQLENGQIKYVPLTLDLSHTDGDVKTLFSGDDAPWPKEMQSIGELTFGMSLSGYVTDGPFFFKTGTEQLGMLWSSWGENRYAQGVAYSSSGRLEGPWIQQKTPLVAENSGHGMLFTTFDGKTLMSLHYQLLDDNPGPRKPMLLEVDITSDTLKVKGKYKP